MKNAGVSIFAGGGRLKREKRLSSVKVTGKVEIIVSRSKFTNFLDDGKFHLMKSAKIFRELT